MADGELIAYSVASFICALFVLEFGADSFIDHTAIVAKRIGVPQTLIALLTAGAEWEELAVVVFSILHHRPSLALGNIVGSTISNILGAFSLGLLFHKQDDGPVYFDRSSKLYTVLQLVVTVLVAGMVIFGKHLDRKLAGACLISVFALYVASVLWAIKKGTLAAPELSDDEDSSDSEVDDITSDHNIDAAERGPAGHTYASTLVTELGMSDLLFGVVILSIATTLPEKFVAVVSGARGQSGILVANTVGSNIFLLTLCMGIFLVSTGEHSDRGSVNVVEIGFMLGSSLLLTAAVYLAFFALSSCLGDEIRAAWSGRSMTNMPTTYGLQYARIMGQSGQQAGWEQIEMEDMLDERYHRGEESD
ncbi:hypothetical protein B0A55_01833 [Friedmanniomyces simplex]|uniref:Sodium/calcium exchanger membrane region domain-containing protein n=1 Tax=Friedmanniomyces simplex TaxID=329884 RepID=A0A4V5NGT8_9PEZI|nr:hypothetical protein B0A55_01833 [Friedmanniomyces simplex]